MPRSLMFGLAAVCIFAVVAAAMMRLMPQPLRDSDYMVIGSVATLVALLVLFLAMLATARPSDIFFKKRKKP
jgi:ABC-type Fe3+-siderophore transport system permease subunit